MTYTAQCLRIARGQVTLAIQVRARSVLIQVLDSTALEVILSPQDQSISHQLETKALEVPTQLGSRSADNLVPVAIIHAALVTTKAHATVQEIMNPSQVPGTMGTQLPSKHIQPATLKDTVLILI